MLGVDTADGVALVDIAARRARASPGRAPTTARRGRWRSTCTRSGSRSTATTGEVTILRSIQAVDAGTVLHPEQLRGQVEGGVGQAIGTSLFEEVRLDDEGRVTTASFRAYHVPQMIDLPRTEVLFAQTTDDLGPARRQVDERGARTTRSPPPWPTRSATPSASAPTSCRCRPTASGASPDRARRR